VDLVSTESSRKHWATRNKWAHWTTSWG